MEHILKITGSASLPEPLEVNKDYLISVNATITDITKSVDDEGGFNYTYKAKQRTCEVLKDNGVILKGKDKSRLSQQLRKRIWIANEEWKLGDEDEVYEKVMKAIIGNLDSILDLIKAK